MKTDLVQPLAEIATQLVDVIGAGAGPIAPGACRGTQRGKTTLRSVDPVLGAYCATDQLGAGRARARRLLTQQGYFMVIEVDLGPMHTITIHQETSAMI